ncbi:MAG: L-serine ammonia-lyase, iron-sulfur-dependent, subunit alpha [Fervidobacterium sp.]
MIKELFFDNVKLSYGCTEPVAVGLSVAVGKKYLVGKLKKIHVTMDRNTYKNGLEVGIPGTHLHGFALAIALAYLVGRPELGLQVFKDVDLEAVEKAKEIIDKVMVDYENNYSLHIKARLIGDNEVVVEVTDSHDNVSKIVVDGKEVYNTQTSVSFKKDFVRSIKLDDIFEYIEDPHLDVVEVVESAIKYNLEAARLGKKMDGNFGKLLDGIHSYVAAGVDIRMSGELIPIMTVAGSGNQGISCIVPPALYGIKKRMERDKVIKSVLLSILVTIYIKSYTGKLTPICGAGSIASAGSSAAITYLMNGTKEQMKNAINNVLATLFGMTCDGAKRGCALKASIGTQMAFESSKLAINNTNIPCGNGFAAQDVEVTISRIELLTNSLRQFDKDVIEFIGHC